MELTTQQLASSPSGILPRPLTITEYNHTNKQDLTHAHKGQEHIKWKSILCWLHTEMKSVEGIAAVL